MSIEFILKSAFVGFEGEDGGEGGEGGETVKTYTEEEFNSHMAGLRRKYDAQLEETKKAQKQLATQLAQAKERKGLSDDERKALESKIAELESKYMTDQEKAERRAAEERDKYAHDIENLTAEAADWKSRYEQETVRNKIAKAAEANKAKAFQIEAILGPMVVFEEVKNEEGESTGATAPVVNFPDVDSKTKQPITMKYTVEEAVERMTQLDQYGNLFEDTMKSGLNGTKNSSTASKDLSQVAKNPAEYRRLRREKPELFS